MKRDQSEGVDEGVGVMVHQSKGVDGEWGCIKRVSKSDDVMVMGVLSRIDKQVPYRGKV